MHKDQSLYTSCKNRMLKCKWVTIADLYTCNVCLSRRCTTSARSAIFTLYLQICPPTHPYTFMHKFYVPPYHWCYFSSSSSAPSSTWWLNDSVLSIVCGNGQICGYWVNLPLPYPFLDIFPFDRHSKISTCFSHSNTPHSTSSPTLALSCRTPLLNTSVAWLCLLI